MAERYTVAKLSVFCTISCDTLNSFHNAVPNGGQQTDLYHRTDNSRHEIADDGSLRAAVAVLLVQLGSYCPPSALMAQI